MTDPDRLTELVSAHWDLRGLIDFAVAQDCQLLYATVLPNLILVPRRDDVEAPPRSVDGSAVPMPERGDLLGTIAADTVDVAVDVYETG